MLRNGPCDAAITLQAQPAKAEVVWMLQLLGTHDIDLSGPISEDHCRSMSDGRSHDEIVEISDGDLIL